jgi:hypothetical protein
MVIWIFHSSPGRTGGGSWLFLNNLIDAFNLPSYDAFLKANAWLWSFENAKDSSISVELMLRQIFTQIGIKLLLRWIQICCGSNSVR